MNDTKMLKAIDEKMNTNKKKCSVSKNTLKTIFFSVISLFVIFAASMQIYMYHLLHVSCSKVSTPPFVAGGSLSCSFIAIFFWRVCEKNNWKWLAKVSLFVWVLVVCVGIVSVGMTFGQSLLYSEVCPSIDEQLKDDSVQYLQISSGILLILSVALPHIYKIKKISSDNKQLIVNDNAGNPVVSSANENNNNMYRPLIFVQE